MHHTDSYIAAARARTYSTTHDFFKTIPQKKENNSCHAKAVCFTKAQYTF